MAKSKILSVVFINIDNVLYCIQLLEMTDLLDSIKTVEYVCGTGKEEHSNGFGFQIQNKYA